MLFRRDVLKKVDGAEVAAIAGDDWARVWNKLKITPRLSGRVLIGQVNIDGRYAFPIIAQVGYDSTANVIEILRKSLSLTALESIEFISCKRDRDSILEIVEERLVSYDSDDESEE
jgi:hypothetical protein